MGTAEDAGLAFAVLGDKLQALADDRNALAAALAQANTDRDAALASAAALAQIHADDVLLIGQLQAEVTRLRALVPTPVGLGVNSTHASEWKAKGGPVEWSRVFAQTQAWSTSAGPWKLVADAAGRGERVAASSKPPSSMASIATGSQDAYFRAIATGLAALPTKGVYTFQHEPEDDIQRNDFTAAQFIAASKRVYGVMRPILQPAGWRLAVCLMGWTADPASGRDINTYLDQGLLDLLDVIAWDPYNASGAADGGSAYATTDPRLFSPARLFTPCADATLARNKVPMIFETGCARRSADAAGLERSQWWEMAAGLPSMGEFEAIMHFEMASVDGFPNWAIRDELRSLAAFKSIAG